jgi:hypothetical protein
VRDLDHAASGLEKLITNSMRHAPPDHAPVLAWPLACGSAVAERTTAREFADGALRVEVPDAEWKRQLMQLAPRYLAALNRYSRRNVERIEFVIRRP